jgi:hypothetical protein
MPKRTRNTIIRFVIAFGVMFGMIVSPRGMILSHNATILAFAEAARHAVLMPHGEELGHVHDDGEEDEQAPDHSHGHNAGDHSHDTASSLPYFTLTIPASSHRWEAGLHALIDLNTRFPLDRPPKSIFLA